MLSCKGMQLAPPLWSGTTQKPDGQHSAGTEQAGQEKGQHLLIVRIFSRSGRAKHGFGGFDFFTHGFVHGAGFFRIQTQTLKGTHFGTVYAR